MGFLLRGAFLCVAVCSGGGVCGRLWGRIAEGRLCCQGAGGTRYNRIVVFERRVINMFLWARRRLSNLLVVIYSVCVAVEQTGRRRFANRHVRFVKTLFSDCGMRMAFLCIPARAFPTSWSGRRVQGDSLYLCSVAIPTSSPKGFSTDRSGQDVQLNILS